MRLRAIAAAALLVSVAAAAPAPVSAQIVPITRCNAAIPCNIPYGLRPADAAGWTPGSNVGQGNTGISLSTNFADGLMPKIDRPPTSEDPVEAAARMYVRKYPAPATNAKKSPESKAASPAAKPAPAPTPGP
jgi:hypothetical protein